MRLGIFGGSFDPVHYGHLLLAECCREQCSLDRVLFVPADIPPHKQQQTRTPGRQRAEMLELAIAGNPALEVSRVELERGGVSYTVDTLAQLQQQHPHDELLLLLGADSLADLPHWKDPQRICQLATLAAVARPGQQTIDRDALAAMLHIANPVDIRLVTVAMPQIDLSSREMRRRVAAGESIRYRTPRAVEKYIETARLYAAASESSAVAAGERHT